MSFSTNMRARRLTIGTSLFRAGPLTPLAEIASLAMNSLGEVPPADPLGLLLGDLLDVDAADRGEDDHRLLARPVPHHAGVVLLLHLGARVHEHSAGHVPVDFQCEDLPCMGYRLLRRVGEAHAAGLHPPSAEDLGLDHRGPADAGRDLAGLLGVGREPVVGHRDPGAPDELAGLVLEEPHTAAGVKP
jgi:hypothetical protein